ncbi:MAG: type II toxin-antitoxin system VapC family toxin [Gammaproteobacteria bacterium]|nr:type II toxin-antitoxin system VapC family toxin [Gammaproteobacteria bacterium]
MEKARVIGLDTNVLVRFYTADDPRQASIAERVLKRADTLFVPKSVVLELYWVLASVYETPAARIVDVLRHLMSLEHVRIEDEETVAAAVAGFEAGLEFEDALHVASCRSCERVLTFDRKRAGRARRLELPPCEVPE